MTLDEIKADIIAACEEFKASGNELTRNVFVDSIAVTDAGYRCVGCALTALFWERKAETRDLPTHRIKHFVRERYGWSDDDVDAFAFGFDGKQRMGYHSPAIHDLGDAVRTAVLP